MVVTTPYKEWWFVFFSSFLHEERDFHTHPPYFFFFDLFHIITLERPPPINQSVVKGPNNKEEELFFFSFFFFPSLFFSSFQRRFSFALLTFTTTRRHINEHPKRSASKKETNCILPPGVDMSRHGRYSVSFTLSLARSLSRVCGARFDLRSDGARSLSRIAQRSLLCNELLTSFVNLCDVQ